MTFLDHARAYGLIIKDLIDDGRWHRCPTEDKPRKKNGAYLFDGHKGVVRNWATMEYFSRYPEKQEQAVKIDYDAMRKKRDRLDREQAERYAKAAQEAKKSIFEALPDRHPYLKAKGFPEALGLVRNKLLMVPMRDYRDQRIVSLQTITESGEKRFLTGGRAKGAVFRIGKKFNSRKWLCEGYATGLSIKAALDAMHDNAQVWVCFSAGNLQYIAERVGGDRIIFADNDESGTGQRVARATGLPWVMSPVLGEDANDFHQRAGVWELIRLMKSAAVLRI